MSIHDKHIELIVRQMLRRVQVLESKDSPFLPQSSVDAAIYEAINKNLMAEGKTPAEGRAQLMGITKASLATESWLSAASFQETTRVLTEAAIEGKNDSLLGLKENIIIGKLIPAGSGMTSYRTVRVDMPDAEMALPDWATATLSSSDEDLASWLRDTASEVGEGVSHVDANYDASAIEELPEDGSDEAPAAG